MVSASLRMLLDDGDDLEESEATPPSTCTSSSSVEADARLLLSLASPVRAASHSSVPAARPISFASESSTDVRPPSPASTSTSAGKTCSTRLRSIALQSQQAPLISPPSSTPSPSAAPSLANIVDASLLFPSQSHSPPAATAPLNLSSSSRPASSTATPPNMVILRELSDLEHSMTCEFCNCLYASPESLRKHILSRHGSESWRQSAAGKNEVGRPRQKPHHLSPYRQASHNGHLPLQSPLTPRSKIKSALQDRRHVSDSRFPPRQPHTFSQAPPFAQQQHQQQRQRQQHQHQKREQEHLFAEHLYHRERVLLPPFTHTHHPHHSKAERIERNKSPDLSSHTGQYLPFPDSHTGTETKPHQYSSTFVYQPHQPPYLEPFPLKQPHKRKMNNTVKLPSLNAALEMTLEETESACSLCIQRGERCFRDAGNKACRSCLVTARPCDLEPCQHAQNYMQTPSSGNHSVPPVDKAHSHLSFSDQPSAICQSAPYSLAQSLNLIGIGPRLATTSPEPIVTIQDPEESDKFKLPRASKPAPPPDAPAFSSSSPAKEAASHLQHSRQSRHAPIPFVPGTQPVIYKGTSPLTAAEFAAIRHQLEATTRAARNAEERRQLSFQTGGVQRSQSDPFLLPAVGNNAKGCATPIASHPIYAGSRIERKFREEQSLSNQKNGFSAPCLSTQPQPSQTQKQKSPTAQNNRQTTKQNSISVPDLSVPPEKNQNTFGQKRFLQNSDGGSEAQNKRVRLASPEEGSLPEDKRGTTVKRPRKTYGVWQARRPQTACEDCRAKKLNCAIAPGRTSCDRCTRKNIRCSLPPARIQQVEEKISNGDAKSEPLFLNFEPECYIFNGFSDMSSEDWREVRRRIATQMCAVLCTADGELWELFKNYLPEPEHLKNLLWVFFMHINPSMPIIHIGTFDPRNTAWELTLSIASLALSSQGAFTAASILREALFRALNLRTPIRAIPSSRPITAIEQAILLLSSFTVMPQGGVPSQWPTDFEGFFEKLCLPPDQQAPEWQEWSAREERTRTAFGYCFINLFRHVLTFDAEVGFSAPRMAGQHIRFPATNQAWYAKSVEDWRAASSVSDISHEALLTQVLRKRDERSAIVCRNTFYLQVALLRQAFVEMASSRISSASANSLSSSSLKEEGSLLTSQLDSVFTVANSTQLHVRFWKPDVLSLFLLHHTLALVRVHPITELCNIALTSGSFAMPETNCAVTAQSQGGQSRIQLWRAAHILQAIQKATSMQLQQLIVPYALFVSVMFLCASPDLPTSSESLEPVQQLSPAMHWDINTGEIHTWIIGVVKRLPAISLRTTTELYSVLSPETRFKLLEESVDMMEQLRLPDRAARSFRDTLARRLAAEKAARD